MNNGLFCVFEGIDGSGKTTLLNTLTELLEQDAGSGFTKFHFLREPTSQGTGKRIRELLVSQADLPRAEWLELFLEDRARNVAENITPARGAGELVIQDRYFYSTAAYQGSETEPPTSRDITHMNRERGFPEPDLLFFLDLQPEAALERIRKGRENLESFETLEQLKRIYANYLSILPEETIRLDANLSPAELGARVLDEIRKKHS